MYTPSCSPAAATGKLSRSVRPKEVLQEGLRRLSKSLIEMKDLERGYNLTWSNSYGKIKHDNEFRLWVAI